MWFQTFCNDFISCLPILKILSHLETAVNYLQNKHYISRHLLKTSLHYRVKHKSLKMLQLLYQFLLTELCQTFMITL